VDVDEDDEVDKEGEEDDEVDKEGEEDDAEGPLAS
jgi:hypothetical protein